MNKDFYHQTVSSKQVEDYIMQKSGLDLNVFFNQYLRTTMIPKVEYKVEDNKLKFRYTDILKNFKMPVIAIINGKEEWMEPTSEWKTKEFSSSIETAEIKKDFYVVTEEIE